MDNENKFHKLFMNMACDLATLSVSRNSGPFGCVIINEETKEVIGKGHNRVLLDSDPTSHAEMVAIRDACHTIDSHILDKTVLYTSCEPCLMCLSAIYWARIPKVYYGCTKKDAADIGFDDSFIYDELQLPFLDRKVKMENCCREEGITIFEEWTNKKGVLY